MEILTTERTSNINLPINGCHEPGCPLPMMPEEVFILFTMLYLSIILIFTFYAFSWFNLWPEEDLIETKGGYEKLSYSSIKLESNLEYKTYCSDIIVSNYEKYSLK